MERMIRRIVAFILCLALLVPLSALCEDRYPLDNVRMLRSFGFEVDDDTLASIERELNTTIADMDFTTLLLLIGMGNYDYSTGEWAPYSHQVYAYDEEVFDIAHMYTLFLRGIDSIVPDIEITDITEDLSGMTEEMIYPRSFLQSIFSRPTDGKRSVSFVCNGNEYGIELLSYGDWINEKITDYMDMVLAEENCTKELWLIRAYVQYVIVVYCDRETAVELAKYVKMY